jgi:hypothetical protein
MLPIVRNRRESNEDVWDHPLGGDNSTSKGGTMKVKIFTNQGAVPKLEEEINQWLSDKNVRLSSSHIRQSYTYDSKDNIFCAMISVWYEPDFEK